MPECQQDVGKKIKREVDVSMDLIKRQILSPTGTLNTITPCAACKLLRRRCAQECPFYPYFSPHEPQKFASVHKVFGASNVSKMLMEVPESHRADAVNSLVFEANLRLSDPVYGCMGAISALQQQVQALEMELQAVRAEILRHKLRQASSVSAIMDATSCGALLEPCGEVLGSAPAQENLQGIPMSLSDASSSTIYPSHMATGHNLPYFE